MYECFHCGQRAVIWDSDFDAEDYGYEDAGIIHQLHCANCGADIQYHIIFGRQEDEGTEVSR